jgi:capsular polysaccharide biosynthesis protein
VGVALLLEVANPNLRNVQDVERVLEVPVLATLPEMHPSHGRKR